MTCPANEELRDEQDDTRSRKPRKDRYRDVHRSWILGCDPNTSPSLLNAILPRAISSLRAMPFGEAAYEVTLFCRACLSN